MRVTPVPGKPNLLLGAYDVADVGYVAEEFFVSGTATSHAGNTADYTTRIVVLSPADAARCNGTVLVEWLNVSGGIDAPAVWFMAHREMVRAGYAYVAVSAQRVGVEGGVSLTGFDMSLKAQDPARYAELTHPGDAFSYDVFSQIGTLIRDGALASVRADYVVALGESQSAMFLTSYVNAVDPVAAVYDGFLVHSRFGPAAALDGAPLIDASGHPAPAPAVPFRADLRVPVLTLITETDLVGARLGGYHAARRQDDDRFRCWEVTGTAHADNYTIQVGPIDTGHAAPETIVAAYAPTDVLMGQRLTHAINFAPQHHYVLQAGLAALHHWVRTGVPPTHGAPLETTGTEPPRLVLDADGIATGGVRTPWVDVPVARTSGDGGEDTAMSFLFGSGELFDDATLRRLYPRGAGDYLERFTVALDDAIGAGFLLAADRAEILGLAAASYPGG